MVASSATDAGQERKDAWLHAHRKPQQRARYEYIAIGSSCHDNSIFTAVHLPTCFTAYPQAATMHLSVCVCVCQRPRLMCAANAFYKSCKYTVDEISPSKVRPHDTRSIASRGGCPLDSLDRGRSQNRSDGSTLCRRIRTPFRHNVCSIS